MKSNLRIKSFLNPLKFLDLRLGLILLIPLTFILGSFYVNTITFVIVVIFFYDISKNPKIIKNFNFDFIYILLVLFFYLFFLSFFSHNHFSVIRSFSFLRFIILPLFIFYNLKTKDLKKILYFYLAFALFVSIDNNIQFFTGLDIFGFPADQYEYSKRTFNLDHTNYVIGRLSGPFDKELISGGYITKLSYPILFLLIHKFEVLSLKKKILIFFIFMFLFESTLITGERSSSIIFLALIFLLVFKIFGLKKTILFILNLIVIILFIIYLTPFLRTRMLEMIIIVSDISNSSYGRLIASAYHLWTENIFTGVGLKGYRAECLELIDPNPNHKYVYCSTHPHNTFLELLSETGLIGFSLFILAFYKLIKKYISSYKINKNTEIKYISFGSLMFMLISMLPVLPSGSLFSSWSGTFFWLNLGFIMLILKK